MRPRGGLSKAVAESAVASRRAGIATCAKLGPTLGMRDVYFPFALHELNLNEPILVLQATLPVTG